MDQVADLVEEKVTQEATPALAVAKEPAEAKGLVEARGLAERVKPLPGFIILPALNYCGHFYDTMRIGAHKNDRDYTGRVNQKVEPCPSLLITPTSPLCFLMISFEINNPKPRPG